MILLDEDSKTPSSSSSSSAAGPSGSSRANHISTAPAVGPPPSFEESVRRASEHLLIDLDDDLVANAPASAPYHAEYTVNKDGKIVSTDQHLNQDAEALRRFIVQHGSTPPTFVFRCKGTHTETYIESDGPNWKHSTSSSREIVEQPEPSVSTHVHLHFGSVQEDSGGRRPRRPRSRVDDDSSSDSATGEDANVTAASRRQRGKDRKTESEPNVQTKHVTDFNFLISISPHILERLSHRVLPGSVATYRGNLTRETQLVDENGRVSRGSVSSHGSEPENEHGVRWEAEGSKTGEEVWARRLREACEEYCNSSKGVKEFVYKKILRGWNIPGLTTAVHASILATGYTGDVSVTFVPLPEASNMVVVRQDSISSRWLGGAYWWSVGMLAWIGWPGAKEWAGRWDVARGVWSLRRTTTVEGGSGEEGAKEGEWFRSWEPTIRTCVLGRMKSEVPMTMPLEGMAMRAGMDLGGYVVLQPLGL
ncbi:hypothetical protein PUNSTDRAFT_120702 [Punctularia strigosozonata HHB-11173 SS5]|uniref:uncharacterized protein n=1 Tax=Punctularia strigosozonata (strain HHB-11173) TaxID=741275 RepID=UPI0004417B05|nr:uncharacterized protein PUNSTDRAFT_120702 [Punctularia strigosozonata HHB-11173 SS5]EIN08293.1 hypothetical protein PUNSTDRAFT_120702 [Punctularia strigosozonata HHB-11173 SS5]